MKSIPTTFLVCLLLTVGCTLSFRYFKNPVATATSQQNRGEDEERGENRERFPEDSFRYSAAAFHALLHAVERMPTDKGDRSINSWEPIGPDTIHINDSIHFCGRARCVQVYTAQNQQDLGIRVSTGSGGLWNMKSENGLIVAESLQGDLPILDIGAFAIHPQNLNVMIAGTGEPGAGMGVGLFKTTNGGQHWDETNAPFGRANCYHKILYNSQRPDTIFAASSSGLFRSTNGGDTWNTALQGDVTDVVLNPIHPDTVYATRISGGFFLSIDGGVNFFPINSPPVPWGHTAMAIAPSSPNILYACVLTGGNSTNIYKTADYGGSWTRCRVTNYLGMVDTFSIHWNQGYFNNTITVHPTDPNIVIVGAGDITRSTDGFNFAEGYGTDGHHDHHCFAWRSDGSLLDANDGGLFVSYNNGATMNASLNYLPVAQFYQYDLCDSKPDIILGSLQDNGNIYRNANSGNWRWDYVTGGDGFSCGINPRDETDAIAQVNGDLYRSPTGSGPWPYMVVPTLIPEGFFLPNYERSTAPSLPKMEAAWVKGQRELYRRDTTDVWAAVNNPSVFDQPILQYALGNRTNANELQHVYVTLSAASLNEIFVRDRTNAQWYNITRNLPSGPAESYKVATAYYNNDVAYTACVSGDSMGKVYFTVDAGITDWVDITGNLPRGMRINCIANNPLNPNEIFIGTFRFGVFRTILGTNQWQQWVNGWPNGMDISSLEVVDSSAINGKMFVVASSYGRGMWRREITGEDPSAISTPAKQPAFMLHNLPVVAAGTDMQIRFETEEAAKVKIELFDVSGRHIATVYEQNTAPGHHQVAAPTGTLAKGIFLCRMLVNNSRGVTKKFVVAR
ncbi:MAG TPA: hypothetical protein VK154_03130 [Chitinophagales bacterium]|nr:hypothetical protein [Chitinophagales bacterium]